MAVFRKGFMHCHERESKRPLLTILTINLIDNLIIIKLTQLVCQFTVAESTCTLVVGFVVCQARAFSARCPKVLSRTGREGIEVK